MQLEECDLNSLLTQKKQHFVMLIFLLIFEFLWTI